MSVPPGVGERDFERAQARFRSVVGADWAVVLDGGAIVQSGSHAALMAADGPYRRLVERQFMSG